MVNRRPSPTRIELESFMHAERDRADRWRRSLVSVAVLFGCGGPPPPVVLPPETLPPLWTYEIRVDPMTDEIRAEVWRTEYMGQRGEMFVMYTCNGPDPLRESLSLQGQRSDGRTADEVAIRFGRSPMRLVPLYLGSLFENDALQSVIQDMLTHDSFLARPAGTSLVFEVPLESFAAQYRTARQACGFPPV